MYLLGVKKAQICPFKGTAPGTSCLNPYFCVLLSENRSGAAAVVAEDQRVSERGAALWTLCAHVRLQDVVSQSPAVCQARGVRHRPRRQLGGRGCAAGHPRGAPHGHHGEAASH